MQAHHQIPARTQHEDRLWLDFDARHQVQFKPLCHAGDDQTGFHQAEVVADALTRSCSERDVCKFMSAR